MTIQQDEYKSTVGLKDLYIAEISADTALIYTPGTPEVLAPAISASHAPAVNTKTQYADDQAFETMSSEGETKVDLETTNIPLVTLAKILGRVYDAPNGLFYDNAGVAPYFALGFRAQKSNGKYRYYWYLKGQFSVSGEEQASKTDSPEPKPLKVTYTAIRTVHQFQVTALLLDGVKKVAGDEDATGFAYDGETWFEDVVTPPEASGA